jgi:hypothetical protein
MPRGASPEREREYKELVEEFQEVHRYPGREEEVAARIVNKQRAEHGETREARQADREGRSPDRDLPIPHYDELDVDEIEAKLDGLDERDLGELRDYEQAHRARKTMLEALDRRREG